MVVEHLVTLEEELKRTEMLKIEDLDEMRRRIKLLANYPQNIPEVALAWFLNCAGFNVDTAMKYLDNSIKIRTNAPELFQNRDPTSPALKRVWDLTEYWMAPKLTPEGYKLLYAGMHDDDPTDYDFCEACKMFLMAGEAELVQHGLCKGFVIVMDCRGASFRHLLKVRLRTVKNFLSYVQEGIPINMVQIHVINVSPIVDKMNYMAKPFIKKELMDKVKFHSGEMKEFYKAVPRDLLPEEIGGTNGSRLSLRTASMENLDKLKGWFQFESALRLKNAKNSKKIEEIDESLQDLCID